MLNQEIIRISLIIICFLFLIAIFIARKQNKKVNWSIFFAFLWVTCLLGIVNYICVEYNFWNYTSKNTSVLKIPLDLYFIWIIIWGIIPFYFFKGKYTLIIALFLFWLDIILMPELEKLDIIILNKNWFIGELLLILTVWLPSYIWAKFYFNGKHIKIRSIFQVLIMSLLILIIIPFTIKTHTTNEFILPKFNFIFFQVILILAFPALVAVLDLANKGKGTPFPFDKTNLLVKNGVYGYCKNPIQWSFAIIFIPLAILYNSWLLVFGFIISIIYAVSISNPQEKEDMTKRFKKDWINYKKNVPSWRFQWKPKHFPNGTIYFRKDCNQCEQIKKWFVNRKTINLNIQFSEDYINSKIFQVTYIDYNGYEYKSIEAIAHALEHINLIYACLGWFIRFPIIKHLLQTVINTMDFELEKDKCAIDN